MKADTMLGNVRYGVEIETDSKGREWLITYRRHYPIYPYGNYVEDRLEVVTSEDGKAEARLMTIRDSWNGTGRDDRGRIVLSSSEYNNIRDLAVKLHDSIKNEDYDNTRKILTELTQYVEQLMETREEQINKAFDEFFEKLEELAITDDKLQFIKDAEFMKEQVKECVLESIN